MNQREISGLARGGWSFVMNQYSLPQRQRILIFRIFFSLWKLRFPKAEFSEESRFINCNFNFMVEILICHEKLILIMATITKSSFVLQLVVGCLNFFCFSFLKVSIGNRVDEYLLNCLRLKCTTNKLLHWDQLCSPFYSLFMQWHCQIVRLNAFDVSICI